MELLLLRTEGMKEAKFKDKQANHWTADSQESAGGEEKYADFRFQENKEIPLQALQNSSPLGKLKCNLQEFSSNTRLFQFLLLSDLA